MLESDNDINYHMEPTIKQFHLNDSYVRGIRGPVGSGKTVGCCWEIFRRASLQVPWRGIRHTRWALVRNTYPELLTTTLKTWEDWFSDYTTVRRQPPIEGIFRSRAKDGTEIRIELWFIALDKPQDIKKFKSLELTGVFINEAMEIDKSILDKAIERRGRYPAKRRGGPTWSGVLMDTNSCDDDHWWYTLAEEHKPKGWVFFDQPPALLKFMDDMALARFYRDNPNYPFHYRGLVEQDIKGAMYIPNLEAENVDNQPLGYDYWLSMIPGKDPEYLRIYVLNEYGLVSDGKPVYPEYVDSVHCAKEVLDPYPDVGITLGMDFGLKPACTFSQIGPNGQKRALDELYVEDHGGMGIRNFSRGVLVPYLLENYLDYLIKGLVTLYGDPAGTQRSQSDEVTCFMILKQIVAGKAFWCDGYREARQKMSDPTYIAHLKRQVATGAVSMADLGIPSSPARTNSFTARQDAVGRLLLGKVDGEPSLLISPKCKTLRKAFRGAYRYDRMQVPGYERYQDAPRKDIYSHISEGFQYDCLEASFMATDLTEQMAKEEADHREEIGAGASAMWDDVAMMRKELDEAYTGITDDWYD